MFLLLTILSAESYIFINAGYDVHCVKLGLNLISCLTFYIILRPNPNSLTKEFLSASFSFNCISSVTIGERSSFIFINNEHSLWIWIIRYFHVYKCCHIVLVTSKVQIVVTTAPENCMTPVKVGLKFCLFGFPWLKQ